MFPFSIVLILIVTALIFAPTLNNDFTNWDDPEYIMENQSIQQLSLENVTKLLTTPFNGKYHPLTLLSYAIEYKFFGPLPLICHLDNLLLHLMNTVLVFVFLQLLFTERNLVWIPTLLFAIHPLHVEPVAWVSSRKDVLFTFFDLIALISYVHHLREGQYRRRHYAVSLVCFLLALLSKASAVTLPFVLFLLDYHFKRRWHRRVLLEKIPFFALAIAIGSVTWKAVQTSQAFPVTDLFSPLDRIILSSHALLLYMQKLILPDTVSCFYPLPVKDHGWFPLLPILSVPIILIIVVAVIRNRFKNRETVFAFSFFLVMILPVLHLIEINDSIIYDRFAYLSSVGIFILMARLCHDLTPRDWIQAKQVNLRRILKVLSVVYIVYLSFLSWSHAYVWQNSFTLWTDVINKFPNSALAYHNRSHHFAWNNQMDLALADTHTAIALAPSYPDAHLNRARLYVNKKIYDLALKDFSKAIELDPDAAIGRIERGNVYLRLGKYRPAINDFQEAIRLDPMDSRAYNNRGNTYLLDGQTDSAMKDYDKALEIDPFYAEAHLNRAMGYSLLQDYKQAENDLDTVLKMDPTNEIARIKQTEIRGHLLKEQFDTP